MSCFYALSQYSLLGGVTLNVFGDLDERNRWLASHKSKRAEPITQPKAIKYARDADSIRVYGEVELPRFLVNQCDFLRSESQEKLKGCVEYI